ncbi:MAG: DUF2490 domain-containing protein [Bacteroidota bacterium]|nr:DUF2490 domain-containing protein [Bacteroidota bacterium]
MLKNLYNSKIFFLLCFFFFGVFKATVAQISTEKSLINQNLMWYRYQNRLIFSDKWEWHSHIDNRRFLDHGHRQHTWVFRTQPFYNISNKVAVSQSYVFFLQSPHDPESESRLMVPEHRPFQEAIIKNDLGKVLIRHRYRLEERFFRKNDGEQLLPGYNFNWRLRYQFQAQRRLFDIDDDTSVHFRIAEELMVNFGKNIVFNTFDQNRFSAAFYINLNKYIDLEAGYSHWFQQRANGQSFFNRHILRLALSHTVDFRKKE